MTLVVDAGAVVDLLLRRPAAVEISRLLEADVGDLHAPALLDLEVLSALRRLLTEGDVDEPRAVEAIDDLLALPVQRHGHLPLLARAWGLRENVTPYDASYVALAEALGAHAALLTLDRRLARAARSLSTVRVVVL